MAGASASRRPVRGLWPLQAAAPRILCRRLNRVPWAELPPDP